MQWNIYTTDAQNLLHVSALLSVPSSVVTIVMQCFQNGLMYEAQSQTWMGY